MPIPTSYAQARAEVERLVRLAARSTQLRSADPATLLSCQPAWQDVAHAIFNLKEFLYVE